MSGAVTIDDMIRSVGRELGMRRACYPKWVKTGRMKQEEANKELAAMDGVYKLLKQIQTNTQYEANKHARQQARAGKDDDASAGI